MEGGIFGKAPDGKVLFLLTLKMRQNPDCPNKEYNAIFEHINQKVKSHVNVLPEQKTCEIKTLQLKVYIQQKFRDKQGTKLTYSLKNGFRHYSSGGE